MAWIGAAIRAESESGSVFLPTIVLLRGTYS